MSKKVAKMCVSRVCARTYMYLPAYPHIMCVYVNPEVGEKTPMRKERAHYETFVVT